MENKMSSSGILDEPTQMARRYVQLNYLLRMLKEILGDVRKYKFPYSDECLSKLQNSYEASKSSTETPQYATRPVDGRTVFNMKIFQSPNAALNISDGGSDSSSFLAVQKELSQSMQEYLKVDVLNGEIIDKYRHRLSNDKNETFEELELKLKELELYGGKQRTFLEFVTHFDELLDCLETSVFKARIVSMLSDKTVDVPGKQRGKSKNKLYDLCCDKHAKEKFPTKEYFKPNITEGPVITSAIFEKENESRLELSEDFTKLLAESNISEETFKELYELYNLQEKNKKSRIQDYFTDKKSFFELRQRQAYIYLACCALENSKNSKGLLEAYCSTEPSSTIEVSAKDSTNAQESEDDSADNPSASVKDNPIVYVTKEKQDSKFSYAGFLDFKKVLEIKLQQSKVDRQLTSEDLIEFFFDKIVLPIFKYDINYVEYIKKLDENTFERMCDEVKKEHKDVVQYDYYTQAVTFDQKAAEEKVQMHLVHFSAESERKRRDRSYALGRIYAVIDKLPYLSISIDESTSKLKLVENPDMKVSQKTLRTLETYRDAFCRLYKFDPTATDYLEFNKQVEEAAEKEAKEAEEAAKSAEIPNTTKSSDEESKKASYVRSKGRGMRK